MWADFTHCSGASIVDFEQGNTRREKTEIIKDTSTPNFVYKFPYIVINTFSDK